MNRTSLMLMVFIMLSKVFGFVRELVISTFYGATAISDAYFISTTIPANIFSMVTAGIAVGFIPVYNRIMKEKGRAEADSFTVNLTGILLIISTLLVLVVNLFPEVFIKVFAYGFDEKTTQLAITLTRISIFSLYFAGIVAILVPYGNIHNKFLMPSLIGLPMNLTIIAAVVFSSQFGVIWLGYGTVASYLVQVLWMMVVVYSVGFKWNKKIDLKDPNLKIMLLMVLPLTVGTSAESLNMLIDRTIASGLEVGAISSLNYANRVAGFIQGVFIYSLITVMFPAISKQIVDGDKKALTVTIEKNLRTVLLIVLPVIVGGVILSLPISKILFLRGKFDERALFMTSTASAYYIMGMLGFSFQQITTRVFYAHGDMKTPVYNTILVVGINIVLNLILSKLIGVGGLALATSIAITVGSLVLFYQMNSLVKLSNIKGIISNGLKIVLASTLMGITVYVLNWLDPTKNLFIGFFVSVGAGVIVYGLACIVLKVDELYYLLDFVKGIRKQK